MAVSRASIVDANFQRIVAGSAPREARSDLDRPLVAGSRLTARKAVELFEAQVESRQLDLLARELKNDGQSFYTIGSSGHEGNAAVAAAMGPEDWAFLHYRSGAFFCARANAEPGSGPDAPRGSRNPEYTGSGALDVLLGLVASSDEPIAGGRHKVFGSLPLHIPPQTSTIASQLPKAVGFALSVDRVARLEGRRDHRISVVSFGDASSNHAVAVGLDHRALAMEHLKRAAQFVMRRQERLLVRQAHAEDLQQREQPRARLLEVAHVVHDHVELRAAPPQERRQPLGTLGGVPAGLRQDIED